MVVDDKNTIARAKITIDSLFIGFTDYLPPLMNSNTPWGFSLEPVDYIEALKWYRILIMNNKRWLRSTSQETLTNYDLEQIIK